MLHLNYSIKLSKTRDQNLPRAYNEIHGFLNKLIHKALSQGAEIAYNYVGRINSDYYTTSCISVVFRFGANYLKKGLRILVVQALIALRDRAEEISIEIN